MKIVKESVVHLWSTPDALAAIEQAGRTCYKSEDKITEETAEKFVRMLIQRGHEAMIEHAVASFRFIMDRGISHETVRHRVASYGQESTRYCNYGKEKFGREISVIEPPGLDEEQRQHWIDACLSAEKEYMSLLDLGCSPQIARSVLPTCLKTEIVVTCNFREWRHILTLRRFNSAAHPQIISVMAGVEEWFETNYPVIIEDLKNG